MTPPDFRDLTGDDISPDEKARLERVHDLLIAAGPPPELPPSLAEAPVENARPTSPLPRRRLGAALALAAAIAVAAFLGGYVAGYSKNDFSSTREVAMKGTSLAPSAQAVIQLGERDDGGNVRMTFKVTGLPQLAGRGYYVLYLTRKGKPIAPCGGFNAQADSATRVNFSVPYTLERFDGWVVTKWKRGDGPPGPALLTTA